MIIICKECNKKFKTKNKRRKFCCLECSHKYNKKHKKVGGNKVSLKSFQERHGDEEGLIKYNEYRKRLSSSQMGRECYWKGKKFSEEIKEKISESLKKTEYYKNTKGKSFEEIYGEGSLEKHKKRMKGVFTLKWFEKKYGKEEGLKKYNERSEKIKKNTFFIKYNKENKNNYSKISQKLFWEIYKKGNVSSKVYFAELNHEHGCGTNKNFDFVDLEKKKIIEFNGDKFHANPKIYKKEDNPNPYFDSLTAEEIWKFDELKNKKAFEKGFNILIVWESDWLENENNVIKKCLEFLNEKI